MKDGLCFAYPLATFAVEVEGRDQRSPDGSQAHDLKTDELKMLVPVVATRIKEPNHRLRLGITEPPSATLVQVAAWAGPGQIFENRMSAGRGGTNVLNVKRCALKRLVHTAIFAATAGTNLNLSRKLGRNAHRADCNSR